MSGREAGGHHPAWSVAIVTAGALLAAAAFRSTSGVLMEPMENEFGWTRAITSGAASLNLIVYGLATPFTAAVMEHWGVRRTVTVSLLIVAAASAATCLITQPWQLWALWGVVIGAGTGSMALTFGTIVANRWFVWRRGFVTGIFSAATAAGQVIFVPLIAAAVSGPGWRPAVLFQAVFALATGLLCLLFLRDRPADVGALPLGVDAAHPAPAAEPQPAGGPLVATFAVLGRHGRHGPFWALMFGFFVCGWSTNGAIVTHLVPAASDHGMPPVVAAGLLAVIGSFDIVGTIASGWLTDRYDPRLLLGLYYLTRGLALIPMNVLLTSQIGVGLWAWVIFYGLDWTATVPPTVDLCRRHFGLTDSGVTFGWIYASHMVGAGIGAWASGLLRDAQGTYATAWVVTAALCGLAALASWGIPRHAHEGATLGELGYGAGPSYLAQGGPAPTA